MKGVITLSSMEIIKAKLENHLGKTVYLKADRGRKRYIKRKGTIYSVYPSLFVVDLELDNAPNRKMSFTYSDVLTSTVELIIVDDDGNEEDLNN